MKTEAEKSQVEEDRGMRKVRERKTDTERLIEKDRQRQRKYRLRKTAAEKRQVEEERNRKIN